MVWSFGGAARVDCEYQMFLNNLRMGVLVGVWAGMKHCWLDLGFGTVSRCVRVLLIDAYRTVASKSKNSTISKSCACGIVMFSLSSSSTDSTNQLGFGDDSTQVTDWVMNLSAYLYPCNGTHPERQTMT